MNVPLPTPTSRPPCRCPDSQLKVSYHGFEHRYISPTTGKCKPLVVQCIDPQAANERPVRHKSKQSVRLGIWLAKNPPKGGDSAALWIMRWAWYVIALLVPTTTPTYKETYPPYFRRYVGQLWAARSTTEYSHRLPAGEQGSGAMLIAHTIYPRTLMIFDPIAQEWVLEIDPMIIRHRHYVTISFRWADVFSPWEDDEVQQQKKAQFITNIRQTMIEITPEGQDVYAYWLDIECSGELAEDVYCMADIYRHSEFTLIMLPDNEKTLEARWEAYGSRMWTFPEALLSRRLRYKVGSGPVYPLSLHGLATFAYKGYEMESSLINTYGAKKDPLERLERLFQLKAAIWRRSSGMSAEELSVAIQKAPHRDWTPRSKPADRVYALMGFFTHRIVPDSHETDMQALARLSMANDSDRIAERMISMLPDSNNDGMPWYADADHYNAKLWDIEPECQVCGIIASGALVLDGCRAAPIRWKGFPKMAYATKASFRRSLASSTPMLFWPIFLVGIMTTAQGVPGGGVLLVFGIVLFFVAPFLTSYGHSGRVTLAQPWLVGVKGYVSADTAAEYLYGGDPKSTDRIIYTPSGSPYSEPEINSEFRRGLKRQRNVKETVKDGPGDLFTLIDTKSGTIYYFRAKNPPTVCLYTGREGGLGRYVLCSERCQSNELRKETVLRMPSYISSYMHAVGWVAVGGAARM